MEEIFNLNHILTTYGYLGISLIVFLESGIFFALPGDSLLFTAGLLASTGFFKIHSLIPIIFVSTFLGSIVGYFMGVYIEKLNKFSFFRKILIPKYIKKAHIFFKKYGKSTTLFSRFIPFVRTFAPIVAGIARMEFKTFIMYSLFGSLFWSVLMTSVGYLLGETIPWVEHYVSEFILLIVVVSLIPVIIRLFKKEDKEEII